MSFTSRTRWSDVYISAGARFLSGAAMFTTSVTLLLALQSSGLGGLAVSALILCSTLPLVVLSPITGRMADRFDSRYLIIGSGLLQGGTALAMAFTSNLVVLVALALLTACGTALLQPVMGALLPAMAAKEDLPKAAAVGQTGALIGMMAGPALAGFLVGEFGSEFALASAAGMSLLRVLVSVGIKTRRGGAFRVATTQTGDAKPVTRSWRLRDDKLIAAMVIGLASVIGVLAAANVAEVFLVRDAFGASESMYGVINATWMAGMAVGAWLFSMLISRTKHDGQLAYMLFALLAGSSLVMIVGGGLVYSVAWLIPLFLVGGGINAGENSLVAVTMARRVPLELQGRAIAKESGITNGATMIGFVAGGLALELTGPRGIFVILGVGGLVALAAVLPMVIRAARAVGAETLAAKTAEAGQPEATAQDATGTAIEAELDGIVEEGDRVKPVPVLA